MDKNITFSGETFAALGVCALLAVAIPVLAIIIYKKKVKDAWLPAVFIGAGTFFLFAMILESLLHVVMLPLIGDSVVWYVIYGSLAAGVFEETGRFVAYKTLMKKHYTTKNSIMMGLGHGGFEAAFVIAANMITYIALGMLINSMGMDELLKLLGTAPDQVDALVDQLSAASGFTFVNVGLTIFERILAMTVHVCFSVWVYKAVSQKGKLWLYPAAILMHAAVDVFAALYQKGVIGIPLMYIVFSASVVIIVAITVLMVKKLPDKPELTAQPDAKKEL